MASRNRIRTELAVVGFLGLFFLGVGVLRPGVWRTARQLAGWVSFDVHRKLFPEQDAAGPIYQDTAKGPLSLAALVRQFRAAWPSENLTTVHGAAGEVVTGLLHHSDIEVGKLVGGKFVPLPVSRWEAEERIRTELRSAREFFTGEDDYVFRRKPEANR